MTKVTNRADGARGFNVPTAAGGSRQVLLQPGESADIDLTDAAHHTLAGWVASGDLVLDEPDTGTGAEKIAADADALAKRQTEAAEAEKAEVEKRWHAAQAITKAADEAAEHAEATARAQRAGDPPVPARRNQAAPPAPGVAGPGPAR